jgi:6,7-dimethyl-8-ribityllumazine synthase
VTVTGSADRRSATPPVPSVPPDTAAHSGGKPTDGARGFAQSARLLGEGPVPRHIGIVVSSFNSAITGPMRDGAVGVLERAGVAEITVFDVPGALEIPVAALALIERGECEGVVAIGAVIKGETDHYEHVSVEATRGIGEVAFRTGRPVGNALLTVHEYEHAVERSRPGPGNKGAEAAEAVLAVTRRLASL